MARSFNGSSDVISISSAAGVNPTSATFTISVWVYPLVVPAVSTYKTIYNQEHAGNTGSNYFVGLSGATAGKLGWFFNNSATAIDPGSATISANQWYHLLAIYNTAGIGGNTLKAFVNGVAEPASTGSAGAAITWGTNPTTIDAASGLNCNEADWAIWNVTLSAGEIAALAAGARPGQIRPTNLGAWLPLDGLASPEPDLSGNVNNGTLTGTTNAFGPPIMPFTPRWHRYNGLMLPAAGLSWMINRRDKLGWRKPKN